MRTKRPLNNIQPLFKCSSVIVMVRGDLPCAMPYLP